MSQQENHKRIFIIAMFAFIFIFVPIVSSQAALVPFGGLVTSIQPCDDGLLVWVKTPTTGVVVLKWLYGNLPYLMHVPPHMGQFVLGMATPIPSPCFLGHIPQGFGIPISFHGSSL